MFGNIVAIISSIIMVYCTFIGIRCFFAIRVNEILYHKSIEDIDNGNYHRWYSNNFKPFEFIFHPKTYHIWFSKKRILKYYISILYEEEGEINESI